MKRLGVYLMVTLAGFLVIAFSPDYVHADTVPVATTYFTFTQEMFPLGEAVGKPDHIDIDSLGNLYLTVNVGAPKFDIFKISDNATYCRGTAVSIGYHGIDHHNGSIYVLSSVSSNNPEELQRYTDQCPITKLIDEYNGGNGPYELAIDSSGNFWTSNLDNCGYVISKRVPLHDSIKMFGKLGGGGANCPPNVGSSMGYAMNGEFFSTVALVDDRYGAGTAVALDLDNIKWIDFDSNDNLYIFDCHGNSEIRIKKFTKASGVYESAHQLHTETLPAGMYCNSTSSSINSTGGIAVDLYGDVYFMAGNCIKRISSTTGSVQNFAGPSGQCPEALVSASLNQSSGLVFDTQSNALYVSNNKANNIIKISQICYDGDPCTTDEYVGGSCVYTTNPCKELQRSGNSCVEVDKPNGTSCNADSSLCTMNDTCQSGTCTAGTSVVCPLPDQCHTAGTCDPLTAHCDNPVKADDTLCSDANPCTLGDTCQAGVCQSSNLMACSALDGCHSTGTCNSSSGVCDNPKKADGTSCNDNNACTTTDTCLDGSCNGEGAASCDDNNSCTADSCDPENPDGCVHTNLTSSCEDGDVCTVGDVCNGGSCSAGTGALNCDDNNPCTADSCDSAVGCKHEPRTETPCDDGNFCTVTDSCQNGVCIGTGERDCNDNNNVCTNDSCAADKGACEHTNNDGVSCEDNNDCTAPDTCSEGGCSGAPVICNDGLDTTIDTCDPAGGCKYTYIDGTSCDDGNACTVGDHYVDNVCVSGTMPKDCNDINPCTNDSCDPATGCVNAANTDPCDDGNECTREDKCAGGLCAGTVALDCNDNISCTTDSCDSKTGCNHTPLPPSFCDDGSECTIDACDLLVGCKHESVFCYASNACSTSSCDPATGCTAGSVECNDNDACTVDGCDPDAGGCTKEPVNCDDGDACTEDTCDPAIGCKHTAITTGACAPVPPTPAPTPPPGGDDTKVGDQQQAGAGKGGGCGCRMCVER